VLYYSFGCYNQRVINKFSIGDVSWIDIESPTKNEVDHVCDELDIPDFIREDMLPKTLRSKVEHYEGGFYLVLHFPYPGSSRDKSQEIEVDFLVHKNYLVTLHYSKINTSVEFHNFLQQTLKEKSQNTPSDGGALFFEFLQIFYRRIHHRLLDFNGRLLRIEKEIFENRENEAVKSISSAKRTLLDFKQSLRFHKDILISLESSSKSTFGDNYSHFVNLLIAEYNKLDNMLSGHREILEDLHMTNDSFLTTKTNATIKRLTILSFMMLPLTLISGIFGMNANVSFIENTREFFYVLGAMAAIAIIMFLYFKGKKWL
jgi:magnesium transporter